ncbi:MAG TPA: menaquinone biosynthesis protein [Bacilli bacterium]
MKKMGNPIRIGQIKFTNVLPLYYFFPYRKLEGHVEFFTQVPTQLNEAMAAGSIDLGPISSFAYGENFDKYILYPGLSVSAYGKVNSILLFYKKPFKDILYGKIALPTTSATSVVLLKIILEKFYGGKPEYSYAPPVLETMMEKHDAALLIGDDAIRANWENKDYEVMDLGEQWTSFTGQWMTYAVWAVNKETAEQQSGLIGKIYDAFQESKQQGQVQSKAIIHEAERQMGGTLQYWEQYYRHLNYDFGQPQQEGLQLYFDYAKELGYISKAVPMQIWKNNNVIQVNES